MKLDIAQIKSITRGAVRIVESESGINFLRFTEEQQKFYEQLGNWAYKQTFTPSGVKLRFRTDSEHLFLKCTVSATCKRFFFSFSVTVNGKQIGMLNNYEELPPDGKLHLGEFSKEFSLGEGQKEVAVYFPWDVKVDLQEISLDDGSSIEPIKADKILMCFGDSITQGFDARCAFAKYTTQIAEFLGADEYNKAIGGEIFRPTLATFKDEIAPDYITVAYGINDWFKTTEEEIEQNSRGFYKNLSKTYPNAKIFAMTPIWCRDMNTEKPGGEFFGVSDKIIKATEDLENVTVIQCFDFIPQDKTLFSDGLHPNDEGFAYYSKALCTELAKHI